MEQESYLQVVSAGESRVDVGVGEELKDHGARVVDDAGEVVRYLGQVCETEERHEGGVGAELDAEFLGARGADDVVHVRENLSGELHAGDCAHVVAGVVGKTPFVGVGEGGDLVEGGVGQGVVVGDGAVVDFSYVNGVVDCGYMLAWIMGRYKVK